MEVEGSNKKIFEMNKLPILFLSFSSVQQARGSVL
jgi:hypothetical protein